MLKRILSLVLCLMMVLTSVCAFAQEDYSLAEKLQRQIEFGNGVKGAMVINAQGEGTLAQLLAPLNGTEIQIRSIKDQSGSDFQLSLYTLDGEEQVGLTRLWSQGENLYMSSELLPALVLTYATGGDLIESMMPDAENVGWYSAAMNLLTVPETVWDEEWAPLMEPYYAQIELWLADYAAEPQVNHGEKGEILMTVRYEIPAEDVKAQIKVMLGKLFSDDALLRMLRTQLTDEQQYVYLTSGLQYYYAAALDAIVLEGDIVLERDLSTRGETVSTSVQFPLPASAAWQMLTLDETSNAMRISLAGEAQSISVEMEIANGSEYGGVVRVDPAADDAQSCAIAFRLTRNFAHSEDEDTRAHDITTWKLEASVEESVLGDEDYLQFEPISATLMTHVHSKSARSNATTLEVSAAFAQGADSISVAGSIKTSSPWVMDKLSVEGAEDVSAMTESYLMEIMGEMWSNLSAEMYALKGIELPVPATTTDIAP